MTQVQTTELRDHLGVSATARGPAVSVIAASAAAIGLIIAARLTPDLFDRPVTEFVDSIAKSWKFLDYLARALDRFNMVQGGVILAIGSAALVQAQDRSTRARLVIGGVAAALAASLSRLMQLFLPNSPRPMFDPHLPWKAPYGVDLNTLRDWSSFPSDHASLLFGLAFAIWLANRRLGGLALLAASVLGLVRVYEGEHYLSDILGGAFLAIFAVSGVLQLCRRVEDKLYDLAMARPALSAAAAFMFFSQAACLFDDVRGFWSGVGKHFF